MNKEDNSTLLVVRYYDPDKRREFYAEGFREEGEEKRIFKRNIEIIKNMFNKKYKIEEIEEITGLTKEEILKLKEEK